MIKVRKTFTVSFTLAGKTWQNEYQNPEEARALFQELMTLGVKRLTVTEIETTTKGQCQVYIGSNSGILKAG